MKSRRLSPHGNDERLLHGLAADDVVVDVRKGDPRGGARGHVHLDELLRRRIEEVARGDEECGAAVPYLVALAAVWKLSDWQEALREDGVRVGDVITSRLDEGDELKEPIFARLHGAPSSRSSFSWIASSIQWCRDGGTRRSASTVSIRAMSSGESRSCTSFVRTSPAPSPGTLPPRSTARSPRPSAGVCA